MSRRVLSVLALGILLALTTTTWALAEHAAGPGALAAVAVAKAAVILLVFLELDRSSPGWAVLGVAVATAIAGGAALLMMG